MKVGTNCSNGLSRLCLSVSLTPAFYLNSIPVSGRSISLGCEMLVPGACRDGGAQINNSVCGVGLTKPHLKDPRKCGQEIIPDRTQSRSLVAAAVGCCRCPADPQPKARVLPHRVILGVCHPHRHCQNPSIISRCDIAPPVCPLQGQQLKREVMKTAGHERALQGLIKGAEHSVSTARILRQIGLEMWVRKVRKSKRIFRN